MQEIYKYCCVFRYHPRGDRTHIRRNARCAPQRCALMRLRAAQRKAGNGQPQTDTSRVHGMQLIGSTSTRAGVRSSTCMWAPVESPGILPARVAIGVASQTVSPLSTKMFARSKYLFVYPLKSPTYTPLPPLDTAPTRVTTPGYMGYA